MIVPDVHVRRLVREWAEAHDCAEHYECVVFEHDAIAALRADRRETMRGGAGPFAARFGANLAYCRNRAGGLSQEELGMRAEMHRTAVGQLERGRTGGQDRTPSSSWPARSVGAGRR